MRRRRSYELAISEISLNETLSLLVAFFLRYLEIPVISRLYFTGAFLTTAGCALDIISPFSLYFNFDLIFHQVSSLVRYPFFVFFE